MTPTVKNSRHALRSFALWAGAGLLAALLAATMIFNLVFLPRAFGSIEGTSGVAIELRRASYVPGFGLSVRDLVISFTDPLSHSTGIVMTSRRARMRFRLDLISAALQRDYRRFLDQPPRLRFRDSRIAFRSDVLTVEPVDFSDLRVGPHSEAVEIIAGGDRHSVSAVLTVDPADVGASEIRSARVSIRDVDLRSEPGFSGNVSAHVDFAGTLRELRASGSVEAKSASLLIPAISPERISNMAFQYDFVAAFRPGPAYPPPFRTHPSRPPLEFPKGELTITSGEAVFNGLEAAFSPTITGLLSGPVSVAFELSSRSPVASVIRAVPPEISGAVGDMDIAGSLDLFLWAVVPVDAASGMVWRSMSELHDFAVTSIPEAINVFGLRDEFLHSIADPDTGSTRHILLPEYQPASMAWMLLHSEHSERRILNRRQENALIAAQRPEPTVTRVNGQSPEYDPTFRYVRLADISPWVIRAVLTAEDGDFFFYRGINPVTLADAIELNLDAGEIRYGASTISMQLVKMLFLEQERVFSRKLQELFLTYVMEQLVPVPKDRILELYLNLAEFGPGIYGIADAARYHFNTDPGSLTAAQATWLASILPAPGVWSKNHENGRVDEEQYRRVLRLYRIMVERERMSASEYAAAIAVPPIVLSPGRAADSTTP